MAKSPLPRAATFSKGPEFFAKGFTPTEIFGVEGSHVHANDGNKYLDWVSGLGAIIAGYPTYDHDTIADEITERIVDIAYSGVGFALPHYLERQVADKLVNLLSSHIPGWDHNLGVRFGCTGTDATVMAVRLARAVTGRKRVLMPKGDYHGWADMFVSVTPPAWGVTQPQYVESWDLQSLGWLDQLNQGEPVAALIIEPPMVAYPPQWWGQIREICSQKGIILIVDEVVSWPRFSLGGACELYGIEPDIICLGKGLGGIGVPISAMVGRREYFDRLERDDPVFLSSTHFGNALGLAAADAVLDLFGEEQVQHIWTIGQALISGLREAGVNVIGCPPRSLNQFGSLAEKAFFTLGMRDRGVLINRPNLPNLAHTLADVEQTVKAAKEVMAGMATVDVEAAMKDKLPAVLFANR